MNTLEPVIAFIDERLIQLRKTATDDRENAIRDLMALQAEAAIEELQMLRILCTGLIEQDGAMMRK